MGWDGGRSSLGGGRKHEQKEKRELTDSSKLPKQAKGGTVKPLPAKCLGIGSPLCKIYFFAAAAAAAAAAALPATINAGFSARHNPSMLLQPKCSINGNCREPVVRELTRPRKAGVKGVCNAKREMMYESHWSHGGCLISLCMYALGGAIQKSVQVPNTTKIISYPTMLPPPWWLRAAGPPPPSASFDGKDR
jgi:hypothetical protein